MVELSRQNVHRMLELSGLPEPVAARLESRVIVEHCRMENLKHREDGGCFMANPPYGERLGDLPQAQAIYRAMTHLPRAFPDWALTVITSYAEFDREFGFRPVWKKEVRNGNSQATIFHYQPGK